MIQGGQALSMWRCTSGHSPSDRNAGYFNQSITFISFFWLSWVFIAVSAFSVVVYCLGAAGGLLFAVVPLVTEHRL